MTLLCYSCPCMPGDQHGCRTNNVDAAQHTHRLVVTLCLHTLVVVLVALLRSLP